MALRLRRSALLEERAGRNFLGRGRFTDEIRLVFDLLREATGERGRGVPQDGVAVVGGMALALLEPAIRHGPADLKREARPLSKTQ